MARKRRLTEAEIAKASEWLTKNDLDLWCGRETFKRARLLCLQHLGGGDLSLSPKLFKRLIGERCRWFRKERFARPRRDLLLCDRGWERLQDAMQACMPDIVGLPIDKVVCIVSRICPCNIQLLKGLTTDMHVWEGAAIDVNKKKRWFEM